MRSTVFPHRLGRVPATRQVGDEGAFSARALGRGSHRQLRTRFCGPRARAGAGLRLLPAAAPPASGRAAQPAPHRRPGRLRPPPPRPRRPRRDRPRRSRPQALDADCSGSWPASGRSTPTAVDSPDPARLRRQRNRSDELHVSRTFDGRYQLDGSFCAETGELLHAALDAHVDRSLRAARDGDPSVPLVASQVRAAALVDLVAQTMRREPSTRPRRTATGSPSSSPTTPRTCPSPPATRPRSGSCSAPTARSSTWAGPPRPGRPPSAGRSPSATVVACSPAATGRPRGVTFIIACPGRRAAEPVSTTALSPADATIRSFMLLFGR